MKYESTKVSLLPETLQATPLPLLCTKEVISEVLKSLDSLLKYKNNKYGDSALTPKNIFSKLEAKEAIKIRLDDKISRVINSTSLRKNDVVDIMGYLTLLCVSENWVSFEEFKD